MGCDAREVGLWEMISQKSIDQLSGMNSTTSLHLDVIYGVNVFDASGYLSIRNNTKPAYNTYLFATHSESTTVRAIPTSSNSR